MLLSAEVAMTKRKPRPVMVYGWALEDVHGEIVLRSIRSHYYMWDGYKPPRGCRIVRVEIRKVRK